MSFSVYGVRCMCFRYKALLLPFFRVFYVVVFFVSSSFVCAVIVVGASVSLRFVVVNTNTNAWAVIYRW